MGAVRLRSSWERAAGHRPSEAKVANLIPGSKSFKGVFVPYHDEVVPVSERMI